MKAYEDLARLKVDEALHHGLAAQRHRLGAAATESPSLAAWTESPIGAGSQAAKVVRGRRGRFSRALEADWARLVTVWLSATAWLAER
ncbi:MAG: hypothetical protein HW404_755 [Anaerolineales bacterium]|nr:hypothetical protein [Anaerolineales bacterium]MBM2842918.1 hypothetical protein [Anaerolineales bacterium]